MNKLLGYIITAIGLLGIIIYSVPEVEELAALPAQLTGLTLLIASIVIILVGIIFIRRGGGGGRGGKQSAEVPIFKGKNVVGYRRN